LAGTDTFRGCSFQAAYAVSLAVDVLEGRAEALTLEGDEDIVDAGLEASDGSVVEQIQAKTKAEPRVWGPAEITGLVGRWLETSPADGARFEFVTNGSLGPSVADKLRPALERLAEGTPTPADRKYLTDKALDPDHPALSHVTISSRLPGTRELLDQSARRIQSLHERVGAITTEEAADIADRLFRETMVGSGEQVPSKRRLERSQISDLVGVPTEAIDDAEPWSERLEEKYREMLAEIGLDPAWTLLDLMQAERPPALSFVEPRDPSDKSGPAPADSLIESDQRGVLVLGPAGAGKTTTLAQLRSGALERGMLPIPLRLGSYAGGGLQQPLRRALELAIGEPLALGAVPVVLDREDTVVLLDGAGDLVPEQRDALIRDLATVRERYPKGARFIVVSREAGPFSNAMLTGFRLRGLDPQRRGEIASHLIEEPETAVAAIEADLGEVVDNPLLFTMALGLRAKGIEARSRVGLFDGFMDGLQAREEGCRLSSPTLECMARTCFGLRLESRYTAERWWWLDRFTEIRSSLITEGVIAADSKPAEELLNEVIDLGLLTTLTENSELALLHDLFSDWFASEAIRHGSCELPDPVPESLEEASVFLAERGTLEPDQVLAIAGNLIAAGRVVEALEVGGVDLELAREAWGRLCTQLGPELRQRLDGLSLSFSEGEPSWVYLSEDPNEVNPSQSQLRTVATGVHSSLSIAIDLCVAAIRLELTSAQWTMPVIAPEDDTRLAALIEESVARRQQATKELVAELVPGVVERIEREIGPTAIRGWLLPAEEVPGVPGTGQTIRHNQLIYRLTSSAGRVELIGDPNEIPEGYSTGAMAAEVYVVEPPSRVARKSVAQALTSLIPRFDG
jgi:hypothetical protein